jgi:hypothetical protein
MRRFIELAAGALGVAPIPSVLSRAMLGLAGVFDRTVRELPEMQYQNENDYVFDSSKCETHFSFSPTPYEQGIAKTVSYHRKLKG